MAERTSVRTTSILLVLLLTAPILAGCFGGSTNDTDESCDEQEYWFEISEDSPYPGLDCETGLSKTLEIGRAHV